MANSVISFDKSSLMSGLLGGALITSAVVAMNNGVPKPISMALFTAGWFFIVKSFRSQMSRASYKTNIMTLAAIIVWVSAMSLRMMMDGGVKGFPMMMGGVLFMAGWVVIGSQLTSRIAPVSANPVYGLAVPLLVFSSMASINGFERPNSAASGPGIFIFSTAWVTLSLLNSFSN